MNQRPTAKQRAKARGYQRLSTDGARYVAVCPDGEQRHEGTFPSRLDALEFAEWGHACLSVNQHEIRMVTS